MLSGITVGDVVMMFIILVVCAAAVYMVLDANISDHFKRHEDAYNARFCKQYQVSFRQNNQNWELVGPGVRITGSVFKMYRIVRKMYRSKLTREQIELMSDTPYSKLPV